MTKFKIPVTWQMYGEIEIEAGDLDGAVEKVELNSDEIILPVPGELVEGSIETNFEMVEFLNPGHKIIRL